MPINSNQLNGKVTIIANATESYLLDDLSVNTSVETVVGATITELFWSTNGSITIARGGNTVIQLFNSGFWDLAGSGDSLVKDSTANLVVTIVSGGSIMLELSKDTSFNTTY